MSELRYSDARSGVRSGLSAGKKAVITYGQHKSLVAAIQRGDLQSCNLQDAECQCAVLQHNLAQQEFSSTNKGRQSDAMGEERVTFRE